LLNQEIQTLEQTEQTAFNHDFAQQMNGGDDDEEEAPQIVFENSVTSKDYLAGVSKSIEKDLHREMLLEQRNMLMRIRMEDPESRKYELQNTGFDMDLVERKLKNKQQDRYDRNAWKREFNDYAKGQRE